MYGKIVNEDYSVKNDSRHVLKIGETYTYGGHFSELAKTFENINDHFPQTPLEKLRLLEVFPLDEDEIYDIDGLALTSNNFKIVRELNFKDYLSAEQIEIIKSRFI